jgi:hypothetical protein
LGLAAFLAIITWAHDPPSKPGGIVAPCGFRIQYSGCHDPRP